MQKILAGVLFATLLNAAEPSAFKAGDLDSKQPYGLTTEEKHILANKNKIDSIKREVIGLKSNLNKIDKSYDGLKSVTNSEIDKLEMLRIQNNRLSEEVSKMKMLSDSNTKRQEERFKSIEEKLKESIETENNNSKNLSVAIKKLAATLAKVEKATNERLTNIEKAINSIPVKQEPKELTQDKKPKYSFKGKTRYRVLQDARINYHKGNYSLAKILFEKSIKSKYKPAESNFYLGQIAFNTKKYDNAIFYYKKSVSLSEKTKFMPLLLLNTAKSLAHTGDKKSSNKFYDMLIKKYPKSKEAIEAKK